MATSRATTDYWQALAAAVPSEEAAAQVVRGMLERWPSVTRSVVERDRWQRMSPCRPKACRYCAATIPHPKASQLYCSMRCKKQANEEAAQLRKTAGIARR